MIKRQLYSRAFNLREAASLSFNTKDSMQLPLPVFSTQLHQMETPVKPRPMKPPICEEKKGNEWR